MSSDVAPKPEGVRLMVVADGEEPWRTVLPENSVALQVAWKVREHFGWDVAISLITLMIGDRVFSTKTLGDAVRYAPKPHAIELRALRPAA